MMSLARQFWETVAEPLDIAELDVGMTALLEDTRTGEQRFITVSEKDTDENGNARITFRNALPGEITDDARSRVIVAGE